MRFPFAGDNSPDRETDEERFVWNGETIAFCIRRGSARRKRTAIRITGEGRVEVLLPPRAPRRLAFAAVRERGDWIVRHVRDMESRPRPEPLRYVDGEEHLFFGERYRRGTTKPFFSRRGKKWAARCYWNITTSLHQGAFDRSRDGTQTSFPVV